ncbi:MAG: hypothetical protein EAZ70_01875 [Runella slithyformis]|nr:MAG: hypothetical protein EAZ80_08710 [Runella slithyformis]TAF97350.1 MAG: hypothetical protein EAZ46_02490 [Runella sp.]TAG19830.1 MAG: hypothetical protein EAZ38_11585 [Cytophagales bacterium]TAG39089.1 MAG: hypothetical protein EAZ32_10825 [Cytophagia bacterium]TAF29460.1 MAG: hypothetical protein EAZ70_01875 [Runella slithyformis]
MTSFQYITDKKGRKKAVILSMKKWQTLQKTYDLPDLEEESDDKPVFTKAEILDNLREAVEEVKLYRQGKIQLQTADEFLEELKQEGYL